MPNEPTPTPELDDMVATLMDACDGTMVTIDQPDQSRRITCEVTADPDCTINDFDCYGLIGWGRKHPDTGHEQRPTGFTGAAQKLDTRDGPIWWEPYREGHKVYNTPEDRRAVRDLLEFGFSYVVIQVWTHCAECDTFKVTSTASLGGIDSRDGVESAIRDLLLELEVVPSVPQFYRPTMGELPGTWNVFPRSGPTILNVAFNDLPSEVQGYVTSPSFTPGEVAPS